MKPIVDAPAYYELQVAGQLSAELADWFDGLTVVPAANGTTLLSGVVVDQAALHGILARIRDLGVPLLAVARRTPGAREP